MKKSDVVKKIRAKLDQPENWIKGEYACDANGEYCPPHSIRAKCYCMIGAYFSLPPVPYTVQDIFGLPENVVMQYNDNRHTEYHHMMSFLDKRISTLEKEEKELTPRLNSI